MSDRYVVEAVKNRETGLFIAFSADLPGLYVHGRTPEQLHARVPDAIKDFLEAKGIKVGKIVRCDDEDTPPSFESSKSRYALEDCFA